MAGPVVQTDSGAVAGQGDELRMFRGIPFAAPPLPRWRPPQPVTPWRGIRDATAFGPDPMQAPPATLRGSGIAEDCLTLNVWTPAPAMGDRLPVMVWIFGGSFVYGSGSDQGTDPAALAGQGVVVVTVNYRLGLFGFLAHPGLTAESPHGASGNYGLLDQIAALHWVQANIAGFGGDPGRVTVFGVSAGAASIALLLTSPLADGLFSQAILQSPGSLRPLCPLERAEQAGVALGADLERLRALPAAELVARTASFAPGVRSLTSPRVLRPIHDGWVVPEDERPAYRAGRFRPLPMIVGNNAEEGRFFIDGLPIRSVEQYQAFVARNFGGAAEQALSYYPVADAADVPAQLGHLFGDSQFNFGARGIARANAQRQAKTFRYLFTQPVGGRLPTHTEELPFVFGTAEGPTTAALIGAWLRFAASGDPNGGDLPPWPRCTAGEDPALEFTQPIRPSTAWRGTQLDFLERYFDGNGQP